MNINSKELKKTVFWFLVLLLFFIAVSYIAKENEEALRILIAGNKILGVFIYLFLSIAATVIAPFSSLPFLPLMSLLYGWFLAAVLSIVSWVIGAYIAFKIARKYGKSVVRKLVSIKQLESIESWIPHDHLFVYVVLLRIVLPVDLLSYALGIFSNIPTNLYIIATIVGITPFAFIWAYVGGLPIFYQVILFLSVLAGYFVVLIFKIISRWFENREGGKG